MTEENDKHVCLCMVKAPSGSDDDELQLVNTLLWRVC